MKGGKRLALKVRANHFLQSPPRTRNRVPRATFFVLKGEGMVMVPNKNFAELIRSGVPVELDVEDLTVLRREPVPPQVANSSSR